MIQKLQTQFRPTKKWSTTDPVVLCASDDHYVRPLAVMLHSAAQNLRPDSRLTAIILDGGISAKNWQGLKETLADLPIDVFTIKPGFSDVESLGISHHITHTAYLRLLAGRLLPDEIDKVIYLDSDLLICDDLAGLWELPLDDQYALAVADIACPFIDVRHADCNFLKSSPYLAALSPVANWKALGLDPSAPYFNSGVMVLNIRKMREQQIEQQLLSCLQKNSEFVWCWDQYALNVVFAGGWQPLPMRWNQGAHIYEFPSLDHIPVNQAEFVQAKNNPAIIHYTTEWKPWHYGNRHPQRQRFFEQLDQTAFANWRPEKPAFSIGKTWTKIATELVKQSLIHWRRLTGRFCKTESTTAVHQLPSLADLTATADPNLTGSCK